MADAARKDLMEQIKTARAQLDRMELELRGPRVTWRSRFAAWLQRVAAKMAPIAEPEPASAPKKTTKKKKSA